MPVRISDAPFFRAIFDWFVFIPPRFRGGVRTGGEGGFTEHFEYLNNQGNLKMYFFEIYTSMPLSYIVWSQAAPDLTTEFQGDFISETIACAPLRGKNIPSRYK